MVMVSIWLDFGQFIKIIASTLNCIVRRHRLERSVRINDQTLLNNKVEWKQQAAMDGECRRGTNRWGCNAEGDRRDDWRLWNILQRRQIYKWYQNNLLAASERNHVVRNFIVWFELFSLKIVCCNKNRGTFFSFSLFSFALCQTSQSISQSKRKKKKKKKMCVIDYSLFWLVFKYLTTFRLE